MGFNPTQPFKQYHSSAQLNSSNPDTPTSHSRRLSVLSMIVLCIVCLILLIQLGFFLKIVWWKWFPVNNTAFMRSDLLVLQAKNPQAQIIHTWVNYEEMSAYIKQAVISSEDADFEEHEGVDWKAIELARQTNAKRGKVVSGGSTITMQLAKNLFLNGQRSYIRKAQELIITYMLEAVLSKQRILEMYLNSAEWGIGIYGIEAGAKHYFGIKSKYLSPEQAARLAAMLPRPKFYDKNRNSVYLKKRIRIILNRMKGVQIP